METTSAIKSINAEEFLAYEEASEEKHEYFNGQIILKEGVNINHVRVVGNAFFQIQSSIADEFEVFISNMRVYSKGANTFTYPDLVIAQLPLQIVEDKTATLLNPAIIIEVLSPSTEDYDRSKKFLRYKLIPSLQTYILISSEEKKVEIFTKKDAFTWEHKEYLEGSFDINATSITVNMDVLYDGLTLEPIIIISETPTRF